MARTIQQNAAEAILLAFKRNGSFYSSFLEGSLLRYLSHHVTCLAILLKGPGGETTWRGLKAS